MTENGWDALVGANVKALRQARNMSQADLAAQVGRGWLQQTVVKTESGTRALKLSEAAKIARALGVEVEGLYRVEAETAQRVQVEGITRIIEEQMGFVREALDELEGYQELLRQMVAQIGDDLPTAIRERAEEWSRDGLVRDLLICNG